MTLSLSCAQAQLDAMQAEPSHPLSNGDVPSPNSAATSAADAPHQAQLAEQLEAACAEVSRLSAELEAAQSGRASAMARSEELESKLSAAVSEQVTIGPRAIAGHCDLAGPLQAKGRAGQNVLTMVDTG